MSKLFIGIIIGSAATLWFATGYYKLQNKHLNAILRVQAKVINDFYFNKEE